MSEAAIHTPTIEQPTKTPHETLSLEKIKGRLLRRLISALQEAYAAKSSIRRSLHHLKDTYGVRVEMHRENKHDITNKAKVEKLTFLEAQPTLQILTQELSKYPSDYIQTLGVKRFRVVKSFVMQMKKSEEERMTTEIFISHFPKI